MHRLIIGAKRGQMVDHKDGNGLNNTLSNLRLCSHIQNCMNSASRGNKTGYKGVTLLHSGKFVAGIKHNGKTIHLGTFILVKDAALAYDDAARKYFGEFARTNFQNSESKRITR